MVRISAWGTSAGIRLSKDVLLRAGFSVGQEVEIADNPSGDGLLVLPARRRLSIEDLCAKITDENKHEFIEFGSHGREVIDD